MDRRSPIQQTQGLLMWPWAGAPELKGVFKATGEHTHENRCTHEQTHPIYITLTEVPRQLSGGIVGRVLTPTPEPLAQRLGIDTGANYLQ